MVEGERFRCRSDHGEIDVVLELDDGLRRGLLTLPHGYGMHYQGSASLGPQINRLTSADHCYPRTKTPYHKHVPVSLRKLVESSPAADAPAAEERGC